VGPFFAFVRGKSGGLENLHTGRTYGRHDLMRIRYLSLELENEPSFSCLMFHPLVFSVGLDIAN
jgi:hypothetical protein